MARKHAKQGGYTPPEDEEAPPPVPCWLCGRPTGSTTVWHHPVPKSRGGRAVVPVHPVCQQAIIANFTNSELERAGEDVGVLLANPAVAKFVEWVQGKDPDFTVSTAKKRR